MSGPRRVLSRLRLWNFRGLSRRDFLRRMSQGAGAVAALPLLNACGDSSGLPVSAGGSAPGGGPMTRTTPFIHGIAAGDPLPDGMIFWTRATPVAAENITVMLKVYSDIARTNVVATADTVASAARDWTVKFDLRGLQPATTYYYEFFAEGFTSPMGRTKTAPMALDASSRLRFGIVSCSSYAHGFFNAYMHLAKRADLDAILHLGDYIYEYASDAASGDEVYGTARPYEPTHEMKTLADYRTRHAYYKRTDPDLQILHRQFAFITMWDDHESADNSYVDGANNHQPGDGVWSVRKAAAQQAYDEWMPIRLPEAGNPGKIWRKYRYGNLAELYLTDSRLFARDLQANTPIQPGDLATVNDPNRHLLGVEQRDWLIDGMATSTAQWKLFCSQVVFHQWSVQPGLKSAGGPTGLNGDAWDAYRAERQAIIDAVRSRPITNMVILTGDVHSTWVADITDNPNNPVATPLDPTFYNPATGEGSVAVEFVGTSVTSPGIAALPTETLNAFKGNNPHIKHIDFIGKGYMLLDVTPSQVLCEYWYVSGIATRGGTESFSRGYPVARNAHRIGAMQTTPSMPISNPPPLVP